MVTARSKPALEELQTHHPKQVRVEIGDTADSLLPKRVIGTAITEFKKIDGIVINHGTVDPVTRIADAKVEDWRNSFDADFFSAVAFVNLIALHHWNQLLTS